MSLTVRILVVNYNQEIQYLCGFAEAENKSLKSFSLKQANKQGKGK
jgi:hypothetical protein